MTKLTVDVDDSVASRVTAAAAERGVAREVLVAELAIPTGVSTDLTAPAPHVDSASPTVPSQRSTSSIQLGSTSGA